MTTLTVCYVCGCDIHPQTDRHMHEHVRCFYHGEEWNHERLICERCFVETQAQIEDARSFSHICDMPYRSPEDLQLTAEDEDFLRATGIALKASEQADRRRDCLHSG
jgi:hypothetical protein